MSGYSADDMLQLSGIQHYAFCPRQWALLTIEQQWADNALTMEGTLLHQNVDDPFRRTSGADGIVTLRGVRLASEILGLSGIADAIEIIPDSGAPTDKKELLLSRRFTMLPVEYKRGHHKINDCDRLQATAQAMALEEHFGIEIPRVAIFYWKPRRREYVNTSPLLRQTVEVCAQEMHQLFRSGSIPSASRQRGCKSCSVAGICMPGLGQKSALAYLRHHLQEPE